MLYLVKCFQKYIAMGIEIQGLSNKWPTDTWQIFGPTIEYIAIRSVLIENVSIT